MDTTTSPHAFSTPPLQTPHLRVAIRHLGGVMAAINAEPNCTLARGAIIHARDELVIHVEIDLAAL